MPRTAPSWPTPDTVSQAYAAEAVAAVQEADRGVASLRPILDSLRYTEEMCDSSSAVAMRLRA